MPAHDLVAPIRRHEQHGHELEIARQSGQQLHGGAVRPLEVVEEDRDGCGVAEARQPAGDLADEHRRVGRRPGPASEDELELRGGRVVRVEELGAGKRGDRRVRLPRLLRRLRPQRPDPGSFEGRPDEARLAGARSPPTSTIPPRPAWASASRPSSRASWSSRSIRDLMRILSSVGRAGASVGTPPRIVVRTRRCPAPARRSGTVSGLARHEVRGPQLHVRRGLVQRRVHGLVAAVDEALAGEYVRPLQLLSFASTSVSSPDLTVTSTGRDGRASRLIRRARSRSAASRSRPASSASGAPRR